jgi:hypothetical protein
MQRRLFVTAAGAAALSPLALAHHGWTGFDISRPLYLEGRATKVSWRNPHVVLDLELPARPQLPTDLKQRPLPAQSTPVDGPALLAQAQLPKRPDKRWTVELAPLARMQAWHVDEIQAGQALAVLGYTFGNEEGAAVLRAEYLFVDGKAYGLRSSPA